MTEGSRPGWGVTGSKDRRGGTGPPGEGWDPTLVPGNSPSSTAGTFQKHKEAAIAGKEARKQPQRFGNGNTEKLLTAPYDRIDF